MPITDKRSIYWSQPELKTMQASTKTIQFIDIVWKVFNEHFLCSSLRHKGFQLKAKIGEIDARVVWQCIHRGQ